MNGIGCGNAPKLPHKYPHANSKLGKKWFPFHKLEISLFCYSSIIFLPLVFASGCTDNLHIPYIPETFYSPPSVRFSNKTKLQQDDVLHVNP